MGSPEVEGVALALHPTKAEKVTVPHPEKDVPLGTLRSIERQAQLTIRS